jgi:putative transposase
VTATTLRPCSRIPRALLVMTGRITMRGLARWAGQGGSYRTVQRLFSQAMPGAVLWWCFFRQQVHRADHISLLAGAAVVVTKAGQHTYGRERFLASLYGKPVPGLSFLALSLVSVQARRAFPMRVEQVVRSDAEKAASQANVRAKKPQPSPEKRRLGRPTGRQNNAKADVTLTPELVRLQRLIDALLHLIATFLPWTSLVLDGHFGHHHAWRTAQQCHVPLIAKRRSDAALYTPDAGPSAGTGPHRTYGRTLDDRSIPEQYLTATTVEHHLQTCIYQAHLRHKAFAHALNVVLIVKTNLHTQAKAPVLLFSSDLELPDDTLRDYDSLRFPIEFNFRDAKQSWGLEDFMHSTPTGVTHAANRSWFMVNVAYRLQPDVRPHDPDDSILDLKADCRGTTYVEATIKMLVAKPEPVLFGRLLHKVAGLGRIHASQPSFGFS